MPLSDLQLLDARKVFCNTADFAEAVTYKPHRGAARSINCPVRRYSPDVVSNGKPGPRLEIFVCRHATEGTLTLNKEGDRFTLAEIIGGTAADHPIAEIVSQDAGGWRLRLR